MISRPRHAHFIIGGALVASGVWQLYACTDHSQLPAVSYLHYTSHPHQKIRKARVGLDKRPNQSQTRANKTKPEQKMTRAPDNHFFLKPEVACNVFLIINLHLNNLIFSDQNNKTKTEHQSLPVLLMQARLSIMYLLGSSCSARDGILPRTGPVCYLWPATGNTCR
jgi:hypothetical protein